MPAPGKPSHRDKRLRAPSPWPQPEAPYRRGADGPHPSAQAGCGTIETLSRSLCLPALNCGDGIDDHGLILRRRHKRLPSGTFEIALVNPCLKRANGRHESDRAHLPRGGVDNSLRHVDDRNPGRGRELLVPGMRRIACDHDRLGAGLLQCSHAGEHCRQWLIRSSRSRADPVRDLRNRIDNQRDVILVPLGRRRLDHLMHEINCREGAHASQDPDQPPLHHGLDPSPIRCRIVGWRADLNPGPSGHLFGETQQDFVGTAPRHQLQTGRQAGRRDAIWNAEPAKIETVSCPGKAGHGDRRFIDRVDRNCRQRRRRQGDDVKARMVRTELGDRGGAIPQQCGVLRLIDFATGEDALPDMWIQRSGGILGESLVLSIGISGDNAPIERLIGGHCPWKGQNLDLMASRAQRLDSALEVRLHAGVARLKLFDRGHPDAARPCGCRFGHWQASHYIEQQARIGDVSRDRSKSVERRPSGAISVQRYASVTRLEPDDPAQRRWNADRPARV